MVATSPQDNGAVDQTRLKLQLELQKEDLCGSRQEDFLPSDIKRDPALQAQHSRLLRAAREPPRNSLWQAAIDGGAFADDDDAAEVAGLQTFTNNGRLHAQNRVASASATGYNFDRHTGELQPRGQLGVRRAIRRTHRTTGSIDPADQDAPVKVAEQFGGFGAAAAYKSTQAQPRATGMEANTRPSNAPKASLPVSSQKSEDKKPKSSAVASKDGVQRSFQLLFLTDETEPLPTTMQVTPNSEAEDYKVSLAIVGRRDSHAISGREIVSHKWDDNILAFGVQLAGEQLPMWIFVKVINTQDIKPLDTLFVSITKNAPVLTRPAATAQEVVTFVSKDAIETDTKAKCFYEENRVAVDSLFKFLNHFVSLVETDRHMVQTDLAHFVKNTIEGVLELTSPTFRTASSTDQEKLTHELYTLLHPRMQEVLRKTVAEIRPTASIGRPRYRYTPDQLRQMRPASSDMLELELKFRDIQISRPSPSAESSSASPHVYELEARQTQDIKPVGEPVLEPLTEVDQKTSRPMTGGPNVPVKASGLESSRWASEA